ncbi:MAG: hypothetical protein IV104_20340 [Acidovorax sp.]|nr:hypothetical protein [Acidovorax sp.]
MKKSAYLFAAEVDRLIEALPYDHYHRRVGRAKTLREELLPLSRLALLLKQPGLEVEVEAFEDGGRADGHMRISGFHELEFEVQLTYAGYGDKEYLRSEMLVLQGCVPGAGSIQREKRNGPITAEIAAQDHDAHLSRASRAVVEAFERKKVKSYAIGTALVITFCEVRLSGKSEWSSLLDGIEEAGGLHGSQFASVYIFNEASNEIHRAA